MHLALLVALPCSSQWDVPVQIQLQGTNDADRQITGLADPNSPDAAVSLDAARATTMAVATVTGTNILIGSLSPGPSTYVAGMAVTIVPVSANGPAPLLDLNGLGPVPIVKWGGVPLDSADLQPNIPARMVFDGVQFQLISTSYIACPQGFHAVSTNFCISDSTFAVGSFYTAVTQCRDMNARLCTFNEWIQACRSNPAFLPTVGVAEWVDHAANNASDAKRMGAGTNGNNVFSNDPSCEYGATNDPTINGGIRCCTRR